MKKGRIPILAAVFILSFMVWAHLPMFPEKVNSPPHPGSYTDKAWAQGLQEQGKEQSDSHYIQMMKQFRAKVDAWLKDLNERIEGGDVTRFEVRFLEILRSLLEWVGEKIDSQIESGEKKPKGRMKGEEV